MSGRGKEGKGLGKGGPSWQHPRNYETRHSASCSARLSETHFRFDLRRDARSFEGLFGKRDSGRRYVYGTRQAKDCHRPRRRLRTQTTRKNPLRIRRINLLAKSTTALFRANIFQTRFNDSHGCAQSCAIGQISWRTFRMLHSLPIWFLYNLKVTNFCNFSEFSKNIIIGMTWAGFLFKIFQEIHLDLNFIFHSRIFWMCINFVV